MSEEIWTLEKDLCRCCHAEGKFKNLAEPCLDNNQEVLYADMLKYCFNIDLIPVTGLLCTVAYTICEVCITSLRDAAKFKRNVAACEEKFKDLYSRVYEPKLNEKIKIEIEIPFCQDGNLQNGWADSDNILPDDFTAAEDDDFDNLPDYGYEQEEINSHLVEIVKKKRKKDPVNTRKKFKSKKKKKVGRPKKVKEEQADDGEKSKGMYYKIIEDRYSCNDCDRSFASQPLVSQHYRFVHLKRRPRERKCPKCDEKIPGYMRAYHLENKHGITAPTCGVCGKKFRFPCHVLQHQKKVHMGEKTAVCDICQKSFFNRLTLRLHMSTHSSEKKFKCEFCSREFRWENNLKDHVKIHKGDKKFVCCVCKKSFVQKSTLKQHTARNHPGVDVQ